LSPLLGEKIGTQSADIFLKLGAATIKLLPNRTLKFCRLPRLLQSLTELLRIGD
jgi:hypothetical protein